MTIRTMTVLVLSITLAAFFLPTASAFTSGEMIDSPTLSGGAVILRQQNRSAVIPGAFIVQVKNLNISSQVQSELPAILAALTSPNRTRSDAPLLFGVNVISRIRHRFRSAFIGFSLQLTVDGPLPSTLTFAAVIDIAISALANHSGVTLIEEDAVVFTSELQYEATELWNLDRADQRGLNYDEKYYYNTTASNVHAYIIDTGIRKSHEEFEGRADWKFSVFEESDDTTYNANDDNGHGSHVAGTVGSKTYGLAKKVNLHAVKVLDEFGSGTNAGVIAGVEWVALNRVLPAVAVMSLGGSTSSSLDTAVKSAIQSGVVVVVAAGNSNEDACNSSPARVDVAIAVAASDRSDARASFSNYGSCVTLFGPGVNIVSVGIDDDSSTATMSGTSMAAPHVAGAVALYLAQHTDATPAQVKKDLICFSTKDAITDVGDETPNRMMFTFTNHGKSTEDEEEDKNKQSEQCTSASPCEGPYSKDLTSMRKTFSWIYNSTGPGYHRAWLSYEIGGNYLQQTTYNSLYLHWFNETGGYWVPVAAATDSSNEKDLVYEDTSTNTNGSTWAWTVQAMGYTPTTISFTYKLPSSPTISHNTTYTNECSATEYYDPNPDNPNNVGQDPNGSGVGGGAEVDYRLAILLLAIAMIHQA